MTIPTGADTQMSVAGISQESPLIPFRNVLTRTGRWQNGRGRIRMRLTSKERILLYLLEVSKLDSSVEVPSDLTQEGVSHGSRIDLRHLPQYVQPLIDDGLVLGRRAHVRGIRQRRKVYALTDAGAIVAVRLRDKVKSEVVRVKDERGSRDMTVFQLLESLRGPIPVTKLVIQAMDNGTIDLSRLETRDKDRFVEMLEDAPRIERFVGRRDEL